jgi:hypothetical protein
MKMYKNLRRRVLSYQKGIPNPYIEEEQTTQWSKQKDKRTNNDQTLHRKLKTVQHKLHLKIRWIQVFRIGNQFLLH